MQDISERVALLVHEEIELAKAEIFEKGRNILRGTVIGVAAGIFVVIGLGLALQGFSWLAWYALPVGRSQFFWGFFAVAALLFLLGGVFGFAASRLFKDSAPPVPEMAIDEAQKIRKTLFFRRRKR